VAWGFGRYAPEASAGIGRDSEKILIFREDDGRWIAEVPNLPGVMAYGKTSKEAISKVQSLALRVIADRLDHGEGIPEFDELFAVPA
jgi:predicted RNase H-like HicB family nuclease